MWRRERLRRCRLAGSAVDGGIESAEGDERRGGGADRAERRRLGQRGERVGDERLGEEALGAQRRPLERHAKELGRLETGVG